MRFKTTCHKREERESLFNLPLLAKLAPLNEDTDIFAWIFLFILKFVQASLNAI